MTPGSRDERFSLKTVVGMVASFKGSGGREPVMTTVNALKPTTSRTTSVIGRVELITLDIKGLCTS